MIHHAPKRSGILFMIIIGVSFIIYYNKNLTDEETIKRSSYMTVFLVSNRRSGSSLVGELLSSVPDSTYIFEPLQYFCSNWTCVNNSFVINSLENLMNCDGNSFYNIIHRHRKRFPIINKMDSQANLMQRNSTELSFHCKADQIQIYKTIRLRMRTLVSLVNNNLLRNLKIIHLVRDPRARYYSLQHARWSSHLKSISSVCKEMEEDLFYSQQIPPHMYTRIRYEDIVHDPIRQTRKLFFKVFNRRLTQSTIMYIALHMTNKSCARYDRIQNKYYSTYRYLNPERWRNNTRMNLSYVIQIQEKCPTVFNQLKYDII